MKHAKKLLFLTVLSLALFTFIIPKEVHATGPTIESITVKQGDTVLEKEGDYYLAYGAEDLRLFYTFSNVSNGTYIEVDSNSNGFMSSTYYTPQFDGSQVNVGLNNEYETYTIMLCSDYGCATTYDTYEFTVKYIQVTESEDDFIYFTKVMQGGVEVPIDYQLGGFNLNDIQDAVFYVKGENLTANTKYGLACSGDMQQDKTYYTGTELMNGVVHTCIMSKYKDNEYFNYGHTLGSRWNSVAYKPDPEGEYSSPTIYRYTDDTIKSYDGNLVYTNTNDSLTRVDDDYWGNTYHYLAISKNFNANNTLSMHIKGTDYENKNYNVTLTIFKGNESIYTRNITVAGNTLNSGYNAEYTNFNPGTVTGVRYLFRVTVDGVSTETDVEYLYSDRNITVTKVTQGYNNDILTKTDDVYIAPGFEQLYVYLEISNYQSNENLYIGLGNGTQSYNPRNGMSLDLEEFEQETDEFNITLCSDSECHEIITYDKVKIRFTHYNDIQNQKIYFYDVKQAGNTINMESNGTFNINDKQEVSVMVKGENLINGVNYELQLGSYDTRKEVTASELANGVLIKANPIEYSWLHVNVSIGDYSLDPLYYDGTKYHTNRECDEYYNCIYFDFNTNNVNYNKSYTATLKYKDYQSIPIETTDEEYIDLYTINSNYHNSNHLLQYYLKGSGYDNKNYTVNVKVLRDNETEIYNRDFTVSGNNINNGTSLNITNLTLPFPDDIDELMSDMYGMPLYYFHITIDYVETYMMAVYNSVGADLSIEPEIFFQNGKKNLSAFRGFGNSGMYDTNEDVFIKYNKIYINFMGYGFDDNTEYDYIVNYGEYSEEGDTLNYPDTVKTGKVTGDVLNNVGVFVELNNNKNYKHPTYRFYVKKGTEILAFTAPVIYTTEKATLGNVMLNTQNRDLYLNMGDYSYIATKNMPIDIEVSGIGFDESKDYEFNYCYAPMYEPDEYGYYGYGDEVCDELLFNGKDLNDGTVSINFREEIDEDAIGYNFYVYGEGEDYFGQGFFSIEFVENKDLLPNTSRYIIEDASDIIKNIRKQTTVTEFKNSITVAEGRTLKVFDKTGTTEITGQIGTGMQSRIIDEYDRNVINIGISVKGDITGDGNISLTDLVKVKNHLLETGILEDVYEAAGDVNETAGISITDLIQMSKDVTGIEELN